jgi:hypothetical protein
MDISTGNRQRMQKHSVHAATGQQGPNCMAELVHDLHCQPAEQKQAQARHK